MRLGDTAWLALAAGVVAYELCVETDELLSSAVDLYLEAHPWLTRAAIGLTAAHLANLLHPKLDPWSAVWGLRQLTRGARHVIG